MLLFCSKQNHLADCKGLKKCLGLGLSTSRSRSRLGPTIERLGLVLDLGKSGKVMVSVSSRRLGLEAKRLSLVSVSDLNVSFISMADTCTLASALTTVLIIMCSRECYPQ